MTVEVVTFHDENYAPIAQLTEANRAAYCRRHGYPLTVYSRNLAPRSRPLGWSKVLILLRHLDSTRCDWIYWSDVDTFFTDLDRPITSFITGQHDLIVPTDLSEIHAGWPANRVRQPRIQNSQILLRCTAASREFLRAVWAREDCIDHIHRAQEAMSRVLLEHEKSPRPQFSALPLDDRTMHSGAHRWRPGDFCCHFGGDRTLERMLDWIEVHAKYTNPEVD